MAVAFDAVSSASDGVGTTSFSWTHTPSGTPTCVAVSIGWWASITPATSLAALTGITYGGVGMTKAIDATDSQGDCSAIYYILSPTAGAQTVTASFSTTAFPAAGAVSVTGSDTSTAFSNTNSATANSNAISVDCPSAAGELVIDCAVQDTSAAPPTLTVGSGQTQRAQVTSGGLVTGVSTEAGGAGSVTMSWSSDQAVLWVSTTASFKAAGGSTALEEEGEWIITTQRW